MFLQQVSISPVQSLWIALGAAAFTQIIISVIFWYRLKKDLFIKKELIEEDLKDKKSNLIKLELEFLKLLDKFQNNDLNSFQSDVFPDFNSEIYKAIPKPDLYRIYKKDIVEVVRIYNSVDFLSQRTPNVLYKQYKDKWAEHAKSEKHKTCTGRFCEHHNIYTDTGTKRLQLNITAGKEMLLEIENVLTKSQKLSLLGLLLK